ncbi:MAG: menaquinol-cytochrome C reductase, partial [Chloroflexota bacterium]|nr:menaquinol-cytochrome C reductase [Chloroflexota bacterium]
LGVGILGTSAKGRKIIAFSAVYTTVVQVAFILLDDIAGTGTQFGIGRLLSEDFGAPEFIYGQVLPGMIILAAIGVLMALVQSIYRPTKREMIIALFTGFMVTYVVLTVFGTSFRGEGQQLTWPWNLPLEHH